MNKHLAGLCHVALWAFLFLSPLTFWRGTGIKFMQYLMYCMQPAMLMVVFYLNYLYLAPKFFVAGKHRYDLLINVVMITVFGISLHYWIEFANDLFGVHPRFKDTISDVTNILRNCLDFCIFAGGSTALALARKWVTAEQKLRESEAAKTEAELKNLRSQINPHFLLNTLNNIYALTAIDQTKAQEAIQQLSKLLRHMLYDNQEPFVAFERPLSEGRAAAVYLTGGECLQTWHQSHGAQLCPYHHAGRWRPTLCDHRELLSPEERAGSQWSWHRTESGATAPRPGLSRPL